MKHVRNSFPLLVVLAALFLLGYPVAFLLGYPETKSHFENRNRWIQRVIQASPPLDLNDPTALHFAGEVDLRHGLLVWGSAPVTTDYRIEEEKVVLATPIPLIEVIEVEGATDGQNRIYRTANPASGKPLYVNGKLMTMGYEKPPEKPDGQLRFYTFAGSGGVYVLRGRVLQADVDYTLEGNALVLAGPARLWLELRAEPDWARPLRITGDYAWADDRTIVFKDPPPAGSEVRLAETAIRWAERLEGPVDGVNQAFTFSRGHVVPDDSSMKLFVDHQPLGPEEYAVADASRGTVLLAAAPQPGSVVWTEVYAIYDRPACGQTVFECFLSLPQHPMPLPHWIIARIPSFVTRYDFRSERNVLREALYTTQGTIVALLLGGAVGTLFALLFVLFRPLEQALLPWVIASQTVPIIALVPMLVLILANVGVPIQTSRLPSALIGGYLSFFPITVGLTKGLRSVDPLMLDLMRSYAATRRQVFFKVRLFAAMPYVFPSFKVGAAVSLLGALISETETSNAKGLGIAILGQVQAGNVADLWVLFLVTALMGILFVSAVGWLENVLAPWVRKL